MVIESMEETSSILLPADIIEEILVRIPVKYLLRWKCVCKHWYALIQDNDFVKKHYHFQYAQHYLSDCGTAPLFLDDLSGSDGYQLTRFYVMSKHEGGQDDVVLNVTDDFIHDIPPGFTSDSLRIRSLRTMGVVNGVVCLQWGSLGGLTSGLWNPATREFKEVPRWPIMPDYRAGPYILGLGFDPQSQDFKILINKSDPTISRDREVYEYHLYSLNANSWKTLKEGPSSFIPYSTTDGYLNNGLYYWVALDPSILFPPFPNATYKPTYKPAVILSFNFSTELFTESELPEWTIPLRFKLGKYRDTLALFVEKSDSKLELWTASKFRDDDYGVPLSSWQLVVSVTLSLNVSYIYLFVRRIRECGDVLLMIQHGESMDDVDTGIYDPATQTFNHLEFGFSSNFSYVESLFSLYPRRVN